MEQNIIAYGTKIFCVWKGHNFANWYDQWQNIGAGGAISVLKLGTRKWCLKRCSLLTWGRVWEDLKKNYLSDYCEYLLGTDTSAFHIIHNTKKMLIIFLLNSMYFPAVYWLHPCIGKYMYSLTVDPKVITYSEMVEKLPCLTVIFEMGAKFIRMERSWFKTTVD